MPTFNTLTITLNGDHPFTSYSSFSLIQSYDWHHSFEFKVPLNDVESENTHSLSKSKDYIGKSIKFEIRIESSTVSHTFNGVVTDISLSRFGGAHSELVIRGYSPTILLEHGANTKAFGKMNLSNIVNMATSHYPKQGIHYNVRPNPNPSLEYTVQYKESCYNFIGRLANRHGMWYYFDGTDFVIGALPSSTAVALNFGEDLHDFHLGLKLAANKFSTSGYNYTRHEDLSSSPQTVSNLDSQGSFAYSHSNDFFFEEQKYHSNLNIEDVSELNDIALARRASIAAGMVILSGSSHNAKLKIGGTISVHAPSAEGFASGNTDYGNYTVISLSHSMDGMGNYHNTFEAIPSANSVPPPNRNIQMPLCESQPATVVQNQDPDGYGRVKVQFHWQDGSNPSPWIRMVSAHGGKDRGMYFVPEIEDEVLVDFEGNNPDRPVVVGSLYHGKATHADRKDSDNNIKTIRTQSGNEIKFTDTKNEETILIQNGTSGNMITISLKEKGLISIESTNKVEIKAQDIVLEAKKDITMDAKGKFSVSAVGNIELTSSGGDVKGSGLNITLNANVGATLKGAATAEVSASGTTTVKGAMVMIN